MNGDNYYWFFSAAAQSIAAFIAFLIAGIALAFSMMDRLADRDDTLYEVVDSLKRKQYAQLTALAILTGIAIVSSLWAVYLNPFQTFLRIAVRFIATISDISIIGGSIFFVASIVDPGKYGKEAKNEYAAFQRTIKTPEVQESSGIFFKEFIKLEQDIREYLKKHDLYVPSQGVPRMSFSFRQMIDALYQNEVIDNGLRDLLLEVNKFRNLLFHGHIDQVDERIIKIIQEARFHWNKIVKQ